MYISELVADAYETAKSKGWHDKPATFGDRIALIHSELSEALEAFRTLDNDSHDQLRQQTYKSAVTGLLTRLPCQYTTDSEGVETQTNNKPEGVWSELADVVIRVADLCGLYGIDLDEALEAKMAYNKTRPYRHGGKQL